MKMVRARDTRVWMLCAVALLWAWGEAAADDPEPASIDVVSREPATEEQPADLSQPWTRPAAPAAGANGTR